MVHGYDILLIGVGFFGKAGICLLFVFAVLMVVGFTINLMTQSVEEHLRAGTLVSAMWFDVMGSGFFFGLVWWLGAGSHFYLAVTNLLCAVVGILIGICLCGLLAEVSGERGARRVWAGFEESKSNRALTIASSNLGCVVAFVYPVVIVWTLFANEVPSDVVSRRVLIWTFFAICACPRFLVLFANLTILSSPLVESETRFGSFLMQLCYWLPATFTATVLLGWFGWTGPVYSITVGPYTAHAVPALWSAFFVLFFLVGVVPPLIGERRFVHLQAKFGKLKLEWIDRLIDSIRSTDMTAPHLVIDELEKERATEIALMRQLNPMIEKILAGEEAFPPKEKLVFAATQKARKLDQRLLWLDWSHEFLSHARSYVSDLEKENSLNQRGLEVALANSYWQQRRRIAEAQVSVTPRHRLAFLALGVGLALVFTILGCEVGMYFADVIPSLPATAPPN